MEPDDDKGAWLPVAADPPDKSWEPLGFAYEGRQRVAQLPLDPEEFVSYNEARAALWSLYPEGV